MIDLSLHKISINSGKAIDSATSFEGLDTNFAITQIGASYAINVTTTDVSEPVQNEPTKVEKRNLIRSHAEYAVQQTA